MINSYVLLMIGLVFAFAYAIIIIFGWRKTRYNRRHIQQEGETFLPTLVLDKSIKNTPAVVRCLSLSLNTFIDNKSNKIDVEKYEAKIAVGQSDKYPGIEDGDLLLLDSDGKIVYVFTVPNLKNLR